MQIEGYSIETRTCSQCKCFREDKFGDIPYCKKKLMAVTRDMHVNYKTEDGTCFEESEG